MKAPAAKTRSQRVPSADAGRTLGKAVINAARLLGLKQSEIAPILGLSTATVSRMANGEHVLDQRDKSWEFAALFVRMFRSLDALVGSNEQHARVWLESNNRAFGVAPKELILKTEGLVRVVHYLDSARALN
jgi:predicted transcriptional regulator